MQDTAQHYFDTADALLLALDREGRIAMINRRGASMLGWDEPAELHGGSWFDVAIPARDRGRIRALHRAFVEGREETRRYESPVMTRSGSERAFSWRTSRTRDATGRVTGTFSSGLDVSGRSEPERRIRLLSRALEAAYDAVVITDRDGRIEWINPAFTETTGYTAAEALGRTPGTLLRSGHHDPDFYADLWQTILDGRVWRGRIVNRRKDGSLYPEDQTIAPVRDTSGELTHFVAIKRDASERVRAEEEVRRAGRALRVISRGNRALARWSSEGAIVDEICRTAVEVGGYRFAWIGYTSPEEPRRVRPVASAGDDPAYLERVKLTFEDDALDPIAEALRTGAPAAVQDIPPGEAGDPWAREARQLGYRSKLVVPLVSDGTCLGVLCILSADPMAFDTRETAVLSELGGDLAHGIVMHRMLERKEELESRLQQAEKLRAVGQLAGGVAHDFNNYLTVIATLTGELLHHAGVGEDARTQLREIRDAADMSARLTHQLLAFSRHQVTRVEVLDLNQAVRGMGAMLGRILGSSIDVDLRLDSSPVPVRADPGQLEQVLMNLAVNARDAMPEGGELRIETLAAGAGEGETGPAGWGAQNRGGPLLVVADTGIGMDEDVRSRAFEPFYTTKKEGSGLGLSTVYGIVQQAGGDIRLESAPGRGTRFEIRLPAGSPRALAERVAATKAYHPGTLEGRETVLVVEDQGAVRRVVVRILERFGYRTVEAASVAEALQRAGEPDVTFDLLFTDLGLPDGNGRELADALARRRPGLAVLFTSGHTPSGLEEDLRLEPHERFLEKPFDPESLVRAVRSALEEGADRRTTGSP